jgi:hypothetical protein
VLRGECCFAQREFRDFSAAIRDDASDFAGALVEPMPALMQK